MEAMVAPHYGFWLGAVGMGSRGFRWPARFSVIHPFHRTPVFFFLPLFQLTLSPFSQWDLLGREDRSWQRAPCRDSAVSLIPFLVVTVFAGRPPPGRVLTLGFYPNRSKPLTPTTPFPRIQRTGFAGEREKSQTRPDRPHNCQPNLDFCAFKRLIRHLFAFYTFLSTLGSFLPW